MYQVLIVEDDPMVAMIHEQYISRNREFRLAGTCGDGDSALKFLERNPADLLILDVFMPNMNGIELLHKIREKDFPIAVIMVTAANDVVTLEEAFRLGAVDYLVKPFTFDRFQVALEKFLAQKGALKDMRTLNQESIDSFMGTPRQIVPPQPKGIQEKTLRIIMDYLCGVGLVWLTGDEIAEKVGLSNVTVRRYMNHLVQTGAVESEMNYETGGRPRMLYRLKAKNF